MVNAFAASADATALNKENLIKLTAKIKSSELEAKVKAKKLSENDSSLEYYLKDARDKSR